jgi:hypothetical protein
VALDLRTHGSGGADGRRRRTRATRHGKPNHLHREDPQLTAKLRSCSKVTGRWRQRGSSTAARHESAVVRGPRVWASGGGSRAWNFVEVARWRWLRINRQAGGGGRGPAGPRPPGVQRSDSETTPSRSRPEAGDDAWAPRVSGWRWRVRWRAGGPRWAVSRAGLRACGCKGDRLQQCWAGRGRSEESLSFFSTSF